MKLAFHRLFHLSLLSLCFASFAAGATLQKDEVKALRDIARTLGKKDWDFNVDPCSGQRNWATPNAASGFENSVQCNCSFADGTLCHVVSIVLKSQSLPGTLPPQLARLPYLYEFDVTRNYLNGTIPKEWGSMKLVNITLLGNRLIGSIPVELANITTLKDLILEYNQFSGNLPPELGNLSQIERLRLTSNNFTGQIPATFARLITLKDLRIGDNQFSGKIPEFIQNLTGLNKLIIQRSGFSGPIPSGITFLKHLIDLRITDLNGPESPFPLLSNNLTNWKSLILRSCNIRGTLPEYLGQMTNLDNLDLSYNKINGELPSSFDGLRDVNQIYLTGNLLTGPVPEWAKKPDHVDLSYNNFSIGDLEQMTCQNGVKTVSCLANIRCPQMRYSIHINCGGKPVNYGNKVYDDDSREAGPARFHQTGTNWAFSSTGHFFGSDRKDYYTWSNTSKLAMENAELYMDARVSPVSLTYYGFCLGNGNYKVSLHFAEIMFPNDHTYNSLGRRVFDVYIQGKLVLKDFNIAGEAGGAGKVVIKKFTSVVISNTLEIHFYWAGKGTNAIPFKAVYGPLISAISVDPDFTPPSEKGSSMPVGVVIAIVASGAVIAILVFLILWLRGFPGQKNSLAQELNGLELQTGLFTLRQIKVATNNFDIANKIGEGGFGPVYKGFLSDGTIIAVKQLSSRSRQGNREFVNEIGMISALQHPYLVKLYGCCMEGDQLLLIYEYMENNCLARALFSPEKCQIKLDWPTRHSICVGIAKGLAYLHEESRLKIVHRDIKASNVLLDKDLNPKISDFGLAKLNEDDSHISTRIAGTYGYMAPEYAMRGYLTNKADVYSFGVVALEIVSGRTNLINRPNMEESFSLLDWAYLLKEKGNLMELVDQRLGSDFNKEEVLVMINVALLCTHISPMLRPAMSSVVSMLEGKTVVQKVVSDQSDALHVLKYEAMGQYYRERDEIVVSESTGTKSISGDETNAFMSDASLSSAATQGYSYCREL